MHDLELNAFLALDAAGLAAHAEAHAALTALSIPPVCRAGVLDNLALLRAQTALVAAALPRPALALEPFEP